jgi:predicted amidophosphoribosyltransferase
MARSALTGLTSLVFPPHCLVCDQPTDHDRAICAICANNVPAQSSGYCRRCGASLDSLLGARPKCQICHNDDTFDAFEQVIAFTPHRATPRDIVLALKFCRSRALAAPVAAWLAQVAVERGAAPDLVTAIPLARRRLAHRGYNQAAEIAKLVAGHMGVLCNLRLVKRIRDRPPQVELPEASRRDNVTGAFAPGPDAKLAKGKRILLVDDVLTTGATMRAAAAVLRGNPATRPSAVVAAVFTRTQRSKEPEL